MTKKIFGIAFGSLCAAAAARIWIKRKKTPPQETSKETGDAAQREKMSPSSSFQPKVTDYQDPDHLIFCEETQLDKRIIHLENTLNMRDIGGYTGLNGQKVKWGKVIRSEELNALTDHDVAWLEEIGLKHIFDFRDASKAQRTPDPIPKGTLYHNLPTLTNLPIDFGSIDFNAADWVGDFFKVVYDHQVRNKASVFAEVLKVLARDETPILFHCTNGKDRTGFMAALILLICGVPEESIISDYTLTNLTFDQAYERFSPDMANRMHIPREMTHDFFGVRPEWLKLQLDYIKNHYGHVDAYLLDNTDLTQEDLEAIRSVMLEVSEVSIQNDDTNHE